MIIAKNAGFCQGVRSALEKTLDKVQDKYKIVTYGPLVHNKEVINDLSRRGVDVVNSIDEVEPESKLIIRSHGAGPNVFSEAKNKNIEVIDATCPFVKKVQRKAFKIYSKGYQLIIIGDPKHPEVKAINKWAKDTADVVSHEEMAKWLKINKNAAVVCQTTFQKPAFDKIVDILKAKNPNLEIHETICDATSTRQKNTMKVAKDVDVMIVIGGYNSSNTKKLKELSKNQGVKTYHIESKEDLNPEWLHNCRKIGVTAGASTPEWIIKEVVKEMSEYQNEGKNYYEENNPNNEEVEDKLDNEGFAKGQEVKGKIVEISETKAFVDIGHKTEAILPHSEVYTRPGESLVGVLNEGEEIQAKVVKVESSSNDEDEHEEIVVISKKQVDREKIWQWLSDVKENNEIIEAEVLEEVKGGLIVYLNGVRGFVPASLVERFYVPDLSEYIGKNLRLKVKELDRSKNKVLLSHKDVLDEEYEQKKQEVIENIEPEEILEGEVKRVTDFGAFIDIGGIDGLCHISEISFDRIDHPGDLLSVGDNVKIKVLNVDKESEKVALSIKKAQPDPWEKVPENFNIGDIVEGKVTQTISFGAFVEVLPGVEGLVHISQLADHHVEKTEDVVEEGDTIKVKILDIDTENKRISLSIKEAKNDNTNEKDKGASKKENKEETKEASSEEEEDDGSVKLGEVYGDLLKEIKKEDED